MPLDLEAAMAGAARGAPSIPLIAAVGMPADILTAAGATLLAYGRFYARGRGAEAVGWLLVAFASLFFLTAGVAGLAASAATLAGFSAPKPLGLSVAAAAALFALLAVKIAREGRPKT